MFGWFRKRTRMEKLKKRYARLMRSSFENALKNKRKSEEARKKAEIIYKELIQLGYENGLE